MGGTFGRNPFVGWQEACPLCGFLAYGHSETPVLRQLLGHIRDTHAMTCCQPVPVNIVPPRQPAIGLPVHYVAYGTPGGEFPKTCRAAFITEVTDDPAQSAGLCVLNPTGMFFNRAVPYDPGIVRPVERHHTPGEPMPLITCADLELKGGTWHWPVVPDAGCLPG